jgi:nitrate reductase gamma subunit
LTDKKFVVLFLLIVVLFGFLNIKSVKIYAKPYSFSTTLLLYKLDTLLLKQKNLPVLDITGFFFRIRIQVTALVLRTLAFT